MGSIGKYGNITVFNVEIAATIHGHAHKKQQIDLKQNTYIYIHIHIYIYISVGVSDSLRENPQTQAHRMQMAIFGASAFTEKPFPFIDPG